MTAVDPFIDPDIRVRIDAELAAIEREHGVQILLAVESGSRAWRFPSRDSDYDVRFIYRRPLTEYLAVVSTRDVVERPIDATLDVSGWDLRKAFQLLVRSNAVLLEWLSSPVRYRDDGAVSAQLSELARQTADLRALAHHYEQQARRSLSEIEAADGEVRLKTYFYALRPALALRWLRGRGEPPPMDLPSLLAGLDVPEDASGAIADLLARKAEATERDTTRRIATIDRLISDALATLAREIRAPDRPAVVAQANALFASIVLADLATGSAASVVANL